MMTMIRNYIEKYMDSINQLPQKYIRWAKVQILLALISVLILIITSIVQTYDPGMVAGLAPLMFAVFHIVLIAIFPDMLHAAIISEGEPIGISIKSRYGVGTGALFAAFIFLFIVINFKFG